MIRPLTGKTIQDQENWEMLKQRIWDILDFQTRDYSDRFIRRRVESRMRFHGISSYKVYAQLLISDRVEAEALLQNLTVHVTHFFRDKSMYDLLERNIIPDLIKTKKETVKKPIIRVWSAGCSTGEEPISTLIAILEALGDNVNDFFISITATDLDHHTITVAKEAIFLTSQFQETEEHYLEKYFIEHDDMHFRFKPELMKYISFEVGDITKKIANNMDIIFCRNTVIYFQTEIKIELYKRFYEFLNPGGFFIMGKTEVLLGPAVTMFQAYNLRERVYRKPA